MELFPSSIKSHQGDFSKPGLCRQTRRLYTKHQQYRDKNPIHIYQWVKPRNDDPGSRINRTNIQTIYKHKVSLDKLHQYLQERIINFVDAKTHHYITPCKVELKTAKMPTTKTQTTDILQRDYQKQRGRDTIRQKTNVQKSRRL